MYSAYSTYASKFDSTLEKKKFESTVEDIKTDDELAAPDGIEELPPSEEPPQEPQLDADGNPIPIVEEPKVMDQSAVLLKAALKKYRLSKLPLLILASHKTSKMKSQRAT